MQTLTNRRQRKRVIVSGAALYLGLLIAVIVNPHVAEGQSARIKHTINEEWRFYPGEVSGAAVRDHDDDAWQTVDLPHTWNAVDSYDKTPGYKRGIGWYRKSLENVSVPPGRRHFVYFEGANQIADVYCNGIHVGRHIGGYTAFVFDLTDHLEPDGPNVLAVRVDNEHNDDVPPLNADFTFFGGIYRDVWLLSTNDVHIEVTDHASPGIFVDTPEVSDTLATVRVRGRVLNEAVEDRTVALRSRILDGAELVAEFELELDIAAGSAESFDVTTPGIPDLRLWSPASPHLYHVETAVLDDDRVIDLVRVPLGVRWFEVEGIGGFSLNGKPIRLNGTNRHQDYPGFGNAVPNWVHRKDVEIVKENGFNFLRLAHYPQDPVILDETDRLGLVVWEEIPIVNIITMSDTFDRNSETMLVEMIRQHYNHPSILMWGYMNEVMLREPRPEPEGYYERLLALTKHLESVLKKEDPTRLSVMAQSVGEVYNGKGLSDVTDILGMNLYFGWYYDDFDTLGTFLDRLHDQHPDRPLLVSEYGAGSDERVHTREPVAFDFSSEHAQNFHLASFDIMNQRPYVVGSAVWNQFDFGSEGRQDTKNAINQKGLYFHDRTPKDIAYYYRAALLDEPILHIANEWSRRAGSCPEDAVQPLWVYSNADEVELVLNGAPVSVKPTVNFRAEWAVALRDGVNRIRASAPGASQFKLAEAVIEYDDRGSLFGSGAESGDVLAVNTGAHYQYIGPDGVVWEEDRAYESGSWGYVGGRARRVHSRIQGTYDDPLYQAARDSVEAYRFDVADGTYEVEVLLVETARNSNRGSFDVYVNSDRVWSDVDLAGTVGRFTAVSRRVVLEVRGGEGLAVTFEPAAASTVAGILVRRE